MSSYDIIGKQNLFSYQTPTNVRAFIFQFKNLKYFFLQSSGESPSDKIMSTPFKLTCKRNQRNNVLNNRSTFVQNTKEIDVVSHCSFQLYKLYDSLSSLSKMHTMWKANTCHACALHTENLAYERIANCAFNLISIWCRMC